VICQWREDQLFSEAIITDLRDADKSRYFALTEFYNCFIIRSPSLLSYLNHSLIAQGSDLPFLTRECGFDFAHEQNIICSPTHLDGITHEQTITCRPYVPRGTKGSCRICSVGYVKGYRVCVFRIRCTRCISVPRVKDLYNSGTLAS